MLRSSPDDPTAALLDRQYMLGESLLVAPLFGVWRHDVLRSGGQVDEPAERDNRGRTGLDRGTSRLSSLPLLVRPGSVVAMGARSDRADYDFAEA